MDQTLYLRHGVRSSILLLFNLSFDDGYEVFVRTTEHLVGLMMPYSSGSEVYDPQ